MRCDVLRCANNEKGFCSCPDYVEIDANGECDSLLILGESNDMENTVKDIQKILRHELANIYCDNCKWRDMSKEEAVRNFGFWGCEDCHKKNMGWWISDEKAEEIARKILKAI